MYQILLISDENEATTQPLKNENFSIKKLIKNDVVKNFGDAMESYYFQES